MHSGSAHGRMLPQADLGGGVFMNENMGSVVNVSSCHFVQNQGHFGGGAMAIYDSDATVINCTMDSNWVSCRLVLHCCRCTLCNSDRLPCAVGLSCCCWLSSAGTGRP
jgi:hypothetical protein